MESGRTAITMQNIFKMREILGCKVADFFVDFDGEVVQAPKTSEAGTTKQGIELEDAINILKLLKAVDVKGL